MGITSIPKVDFTRIPDDLTGRWVVVRVGEDQAVVSQGDSAQEALRQSRIDPADSRYVLTQVPEVPTAAWMTRPGADRP